MKRTRLPFPYSVSSSSLPFDWIQHGVWPSSIMSRLGFKYFVSFFDDHTSYTWVYLMKQKSELFFHLKTFYAMIETHFNTKNKIVIQVVNICHECLKFLKEKILFSKDHAWILLKMLF